MISAYDDRGNVTALGAQNSIDYLHNDHLGSANSAAGSSGTVKWREQYSPFGERLSQIAANDNLDGFTGHVFDKATGLNYMQARYYDPLIGRFLSIDPVGFEETGSPGMFNRYAYVLNDPVNKLLRKPNNIKFYWALPDSIILENGAPTRRQDKIIKLIKTIR